MALSQLPPGVVFSLVLLVMTGLAVAFPAPFVSWGGFPTKNAVVPLLQLVMFVMGTRVTLPGLRQVVQRPGPVLLGLGLQWLVMPVLAWTMAQWSGLPPDVGAGIILVSAVCAGNSSNVMTFFAGGNLELSVTMTTLSTLLTAAATPILMQLLAGRAVPVDMLGLSWSIIKFVVIPISAGLYCERFLRRHKAMAETWLPRIVIVATSLTNAIISANAREALLAMGLLLALIELTHNVLGFTIGFWGARWAGLPRADAVAMAMQVGIRNGGLATGLATDVLKSSNAALAAVVFGTIQNALGALLASRLNRPEKSAA